MKKMRFLLAGGALLLFAGCAHSPDRSSLFERMGYRKDFVKSHPDLSADGRAQILAGSVPLGTEKSVVAELLGEPLSVYISETGLMEIWTFERLYVGFDKNGKVIKTERYPKK